MEFDKEKILIALDEERSISKASVKLFIGQPTLSQILQRIEQQLGYELFNRGRTGLTPTYAGEQYIAMCRQILDLKTSVDDTVAEYYQRKAKKLTIGISGTWSRVLLPKLLPEFHKRFPDVEVNIRISTSDYVPDFVMRNEVDLGIVVQPLDGSVHADLKYTFLFEDDVLVAVHKDNPLVRKAVTIDGYDYPYLEPELLANQKYILSPPEGKLRQSSDHFFEAHDIIPNVVMVDIALENSAVMAALGMGITFLNRRMACDLATSSTIISENLLLFHTSKALLPWKIALIQKENAKKRIGNEFISLAQERFLS